MNAKIEGRLNLWTSIITNLLVSGPGLLMTLTTQSYLLKIHASRKYAPLASLALVIETLGFD
jgi:uncharacterized protein YlxW (UPF0749 family)